MHLWLLSSSVLLCSTRFLLASAQVAPAQDTQPPMWHDFKAYPFRDVTQNCPPFSILKPSTLTNFWNDKYFVQSKRAGISLWKDPRKHWDTEKGGVKGTEYQVDCYINFGT
jgi:hypothetical protein